VGILIAMLAAIGLDTLLRWVRLRWSARAAVAAGACVFAVVLVDALLDERPRGYMTYSGKGYEAIYSQPPQALRAIDSEEGRVFLWNPGILPHLPSKLGSTHRVRVFDDYEPMSSQRQADYFLYLANARIGGRARAPFSGRLPFPANPKQARSMATRKRLLDLAAVSHVVADNRQRGDVTLFAFAHAAGLERRPADPEAREHSPVVFVNHAALPRAYVTYRTLESPPPEQLLPQLADPDFDPLAASYVEELPGTVTGASAIGSDAPPGLRGHPARIVREEATEIELAVDLARDGLVIVADSWYPGWQATVDGRPADIHPTNHLFRGIAVPGGAHTVVLRYAPGWLPFSSATLALGLAALLGLCWRRRFRR